MLRVKWMVSVVRDGALCRGVYAADAGAVKIRRTNRAVHCIPGFDDFQQVLLFFLNKGYSLLAVGQRGVICRGGKSLHDGADAVDVLRGV